MAPATQLPRMFLSLMIHESSTFLFRSRTNGIGKPQAAMS
jgi:hypothetical protein